MIVDHKFKNRNGPTPLQVLYAWQGYLLTLQTAKSTEPEVALILDYHVPI